MLKKIIFYVFIAVSVSGAVYGYFHLKEGKEPNALLLEHIPKDAICVIETKKCSELVSQLTRQNLIWNALLDNKSIAEAQRGITYLDSLVNSVPQIADVLSNNSVYWSFIKLSNANEHVLLFKVKEKNNEEIINTFFEKVFKKDESFASLKAYYFTINKQKWLACYKDGIVYFCSDFGLLQDCLDLKKEESLANNKAYNDLITANGDQNTQVYINHKLTNLFSKDIFNQQSLFGVEVDLNEITFTGYLNTDTTSHLNIIKNQNAQTIKEFENLPNNPAIIQGVAISDARIFFNSSRKLYDDEHNFKIKKAWSSLNDSALYNIENESLDNIDGDLILATYMLENQKSNILSLKIKDIEKADQLLKFASDSVIFNTRVYILNKNFDKLFSFITPNISYQFACVSNNNLLFFSNKSILNYYQQSVISNNLLNKNASFMAYANDNLFQECNYLYYENTNLTKLSGINSILNSEELFTSQQATSQISFTAKNYKNYIQIRMIVNHEKENVDVNEPLNKLWSYTADTIITSNVDVFVNHLTQENELCFQTETNNLHLISSTGKLLWKKNITEKIISPIYTVDAFKNNKFQLLFNTQNYLHLLDRNGKYVEGYPVKLPSKATSALTLLDYDGTKDYRMFLSCDDKHIYNYSINGIKIDGFAAVKTLQQVILPINYIKIGASDYLITADISGKIYVFSRKGEVRIDLNNKTIENLNHITLLPGNSLTNTKLIYIDDKNSLLNKISLTDKKETLKIGEDLTNFKTNFVLINDDLQQDVLSYGSGAIYAYDIFTNKLIEYFNELVVYDNVQLVHTNNYDWLLAYDKIAQKTDVITTLGKLSSTINNCTKQILISNLYKNGKTYIVICNGKEINCQELK